MLHMATDTVSVRVEKVTYVKLQNEAKASGRKLTWMLTQAIEQYLKPAKNGGKP